MDSYIKESTPLLNITEAATFLNVSKATIRRWTDDGRLACLRIGARNERRFRQGDLSQLIKNSESKQRVNDTVEALSAAAQPPSQGHQCIVSNTLDEEWATLGSAIVAALENGGQVLVVEVADRIKRLEALLKENGLCIRQLLDTHVLNCVSIEDSYYLSGEFRWDRAVAYIESAILAAKACGLEKILIIGADTGQAESQGQSYADEMKKYELGLNEMLSRHPGASVLCPYTASEISAQLMIHGFLTHPQMCIHTTPVPGLLGQVSI